MCQKIIDRELSPAHKSGLIVTASLPYRGLIRDLVMLLKYGRKPYVAKFMTELMSPLIETSTEVVFCPVPTHPLRLISRGYNQSMELAKELAHRCPQGTVIDALVRHRHTSQQKKKSALQRYKNIHNAIRIRPDVPLQIAGKNIVLIDDVCTSGATLVECAKVLLTEGSVNNVKACVFALAAKQDKTTCPA